MKKSKKLGISSLDDGVELVIAFGFVSCWRSIRKPTINCVVLYHHSGEATVKRPIVHKVNAAQKSLLDKPSQEPCAVRGNKSENAYLLDPNGVIPDKSPRCAEEDDAAIRGVIDHVVLD